MSRRLPALGPGPGQLHAGQSINTTIISQAGEKHILYRKIGKKKHKLKRKLSVATQAISRNYGDIRHRVHMCVTPEQDNQLIKNSGRRRESGQGQWKSRERYPRLGRISYCLDPGKPQMAQTALRNGHKKRDRKNTHRI